MLGASDPEPQALRRGDEAGGGQGVGERCAEHALRVDPLHPHAAQSGTHDGGELSGGGLEHGGVVRERQGALAAALQVEGEVPVHQDDDRPRLAARSVTRGGCPRGVGGVGLGGRPGQRRAVGKGDCTTFTQTGMTLTWSRSSCFGHIRDMGTVKP